VKPTKTRIALVEFPTNLDRQGKKRHGGNRHLPNVCKPRNGEQNEQMVSDNEETTQDRRSLHSEAAATYDPTWPEKLKITLENAKSVPKERQ
jgi:hypothetical protein